MRVARATKIALVPLVALWIWALPRAQPNVEVAGAAQFSVASLVDDASVEPLADAIDATSASTTTTLVTSTASVETTTVSEVDDSIDTTTTLIAPATVEADTEATPSSSSSSVAQDTSTPPPTTSAAVPLAQEALDRVSIDWRAMFPGWRVEFAGPRTGIRALTYPSERRIEVFVRPDDTASSLHRVFAHELGHVIDVELNDDEDRARWARQRNLPPNTPWWPSAEAPDFATGAGDFAEAYAVLETGVISRSTVGDQPSVADLELMRELMRG